MRLRRLRRGERHKRRAVRRQHVRVHRRAGFRREIPNHVLARRRLGETDDEKLSPHARRRRFRILLSAVLAFPLGANLHRLRVRRLGLGAGLAPRDDHRGRLRLLELVHAGERRRRRLRAFARHHRHARRVAVPPHRRHRAVRSHDLSHGVVADGLGDARDARTSVFLVARGFLVGPQRSAKRLGGEVQIGIRGDRPAAGARRAFVGEGEPPRRRGRGERR